MDIGQLRKEQARKEKLDWESTVSHMYDLPLSRRRSSSSNYGTPVLYHRSRLGGSLVC